MRFSDAVGSVDIDVSHIHEFVSTWYNEDDIISVSGFPIEGHRRVVSLPLTREEFLDVTNEGFEGLTRDFNTGQRYDAYLGINPMVSKDSVKVFSRGTEKDVRSLYGCFIDFDINKEGKKSGVFDSKEQILSFIDTVELEPTIVVDNGSSGGIHAYWRFEDPIELPSEEPTKPYLVGWWTYISSLTERNIDRLVDVTRISRLPSSIYWPKEGSDRFDTVKVIRNSGNRYPRKKFLEISKDSYSNHVKTLDKIRSEKSFGLDLTLKAMAEKSPEMQRKFKLHPHNMNIITHIVQHHINDNYSWSDILEPHGWTFIKEDSSGSLVWSRPGKLDRSATTDYRRDNGEVSQVMSLLSSSDETRLADLKEANVHLTKMQVLLRLKYNDDVNAMIDDIMSRRNN